MKTIPMSVIGRSYTVFQVPPEMITSLHTEVALVDFVLNKFTIPSPPRLHTTPHHIMCMMTVSTYVMALSMYYRCWYSEAMET